MASISDGTKVIKTPAMSIPHATSVFVERAAMVTERVRVFSVPDRIELNMNSEYESIKAKRPVATMLAADRGNVILHKT
jgi:hypothetical protein